MPGGVTDASDLYLRQIPLGPMQNFVYFVGSKRARQCYVVDPAWDTETLLALAAEDDMRIVGSLVTHYHPDHVGGSIMGFDVPGGVAEMLAATDAKIHVHKAEADGLKVVTGVSESDLVRHESSDRLTVGDVAIELVHTPGHTPGSQCFLVSDRLVAGDTLFVNGCGRVDLPGSDPEAMYHTLNGVLAKLSDDIILCPGHDYGPSKTATMGEQKQSNAYLNIRSLEDWMRLMRTA